MQKTSGRRTAGAAVTALTAGALFAVSALPADAMTVTFVRHGESEGNASGYIDTKVPGPPLTEQGWDEANAVAGALNESGTYDGIYASTMQRTQQTATPLAALLYRGGLENQDDVTYSLDPYHPDYTKDVVVLNGLQEINAGIFEGLPQDEGIGRIGYALAPLAWTLGLRFVRIPGSENGNEFDARVDAALAQMEEQDGADASEVVFSHGATMMFWTLMNVDNPDLTLFLTHPLENTDVVVVESNDEGGWTLKSWAGEEVAPANYPTKMFVNVRDLIVAPQTALYNMRGALLTPDPESIVKTGAQGIEDVGEATVKFVRDSVTDTVDAIQDLGPAALGERAQADEVAADSTPAIAAEPATKITKTDKGTKKPAGATDLTDGNKAQPGVAKAINRAGERVREAVEDAHARAASSIQKLGDAVKKARGEHAEKSTDEKDTDGAAA